MATGGRARELAERGGIFGMGRESQCWKKMDGENDELVFLKESSLAGWHRSEAWLRTSRKNGC